MAAREVTGGAGGEGAPVRTADVGPAPVARADGSSRVLKVSARAAVWGVSAGFASIFAFSMGAPISAALALDLFGAGLVVGGVGAAVAGVDVLRRAPKRLRLVRATAALGVPVGLGLVAAGAVPLFGLSVSMPFLAQLLPIAGLVFLILAVASFVVGRPGEGEA